MFSPWLFCIYEIILGLLSLMPFINNNVSPLSRFSRMSFIHRVCTLRSTFLPFLIPRAEGQDAESQALDEMILLYSPAIRLSNNLTNYEVDLLRHHSKQMLTALYPARSSSCQIVHHIFQYNENRVSMYSIQHHAIDDWKNSNKPLVLYFHGGGFVFGGIDTYAGLECHLSKELDMLILHVDFGLAPEYPLARTLEDIIGVYLVLLDADPKIHQRLIGMSDSSGGMLWIYLLQWLVSHDKPVPKGVVLHSPWPDLQFEYVDYSRKTNPYLTVGLALLLRQLVIGKETDWDALSDVEKRKLSPKEDSFEGFPPLYITAGTNEIFIEEIRWMTTTARQVGIDVVLEEGVESMHGFALFHLWSSKARCIEAKIRRWIQRQVLLDIETTSNKNKQTEFHC